MSRRCRCPQRVGACSVAVRRGPCGERAGRTVRGGCFYSGVVSLFVAGDTVLVADGGLATELEARGNDLSDSLWSARLLADAPEQILDAHLAFFRAGAVIATSASYQALSGPSNLHRENTGTAMHSSVAT